MLECKMRWDTFNIYSANLWKQREAPIVLFPINQDNYMKQKNIAHPKLPPLNFCKTYFASWGTQNTSLNEWSMNWEYIIIWMIKYSVIHFLSWAACRLLHSVTNWLYTWSSYNFQINVNNSYLYIDHHTANLNIHNHKMRKTPLHVCKHGCGCWFQSASAIMPFGPA